jgi:RNA polymerase sigma-70 factor (ECF subfamily)
MASEAHSTTPPTLLHRLRSHPTDEAAWRQFAERYGKQIYSWCRRWGLQDADANDVTQTVLLKLARRMQTFVYDRQQSFRAWLQTVTRNALQDFLTAQSTQPATATTTDTLEALNTLQSRDDLLARLEHLFDLELLEAAKVRVRLRVQSQTWNAYQRTAEQGQSAIEVGQQLGMALTAVYAAKSHIVKMLQEELAILEEARS